MLIRPPCRRLALALGTLALATPGLTGCGFGQSTDRPYTPAAGANNVDGSINVLGAVVVSAAPGSGTFVASITSDDPSEATTFDSVASGDTGDVTAVEFTPKEIAAGTLLNLATAGGVTLTGDFSAGETVPLTLTFGSGESVDITAQVVDDDGDFAGLDTSATISPTDLATPDATESETSE